MILPPRPISRYDSDRSGSMIGGVEARGRHGRGRLVKPYSYGPYLAGVRRTGSHQLRLLSERDRRAALGANVVARAFAVVVYLGECRVVTRLLAPRLLQG